MQAELPHLRRFSTVFATIISVAPLLGLLGTILGLIRSFAALQLGDLSTNTGIALEDLQSEVRNLMAAAQEAVVVINADAAVSHGRVVAVMDELRAIEGATLGIATQRGK